MPLRQEVLNVLLAQLLQERGLIAAPEQILRVAGEPGSQMPDVLVDFQGLRLAIEGNFAGSGAVEAALVTQTRQRVDRGVAHIGTAVLYPRALRDAAFAQAKHDLASARLRFAVVTEEPDPPSFAEGDVTNLAGALRRAYEQLIEDRVLDKAVTLIGHGIDGFTAALSTQPASAERFAVSLGIKDVPKSAKREADNQ